MRSTVYYVPVADGDSQGTIQAKFGRLLDESGMLAGVHQEDRAVIKIHFGEEGNTGYVKPDYIRVLTDKLPARAVLSDTNTLYSGRRMTCRDHTAIALEHGFTAENTGSEVFIPDDMVEDNVTRIKMNGQYVQTAKVARLFTDADLLINVAHFKGHMMTGFGGALKNIGMGCASREGKLEQHTEMVPYVHMSGCTGCGACVRTCAVTAIEIVEGKAHITPAKCTGCAQCIAVCPTKAMGIEWEAGSGTIQEKMVEYAKAVLDNVRGNVIHINFAVKITKECDCLAKDDPRIAPDIGIFASSDPVSLDKACLDLTLGSSGRDIFREAHPERDGMKQLLHAQSIGLGSLDYELIRTIADR
jgi:uncharacterized protein